jgi:hypothetical protein
VKKAYFRGAVVQHLDRHFGDFLARPSCSAEKFKVKGESVKLTPDFQAGKLTYSLLLQMSLKVYEIIAIMVVIIIKNLRKKKHNT